jgi:hypothetical protein
MKLAIKISRPLLCSLFLVLTGASVRADAPATFPVGDFTFTRPVKWEWVTATSAMRKAQLKVTDATGKDSAEVAFFEFGPGGAGGVKANVDRWLGQFNEPREQLNSKVEEVTIGKTKVTYVQAEGTFKSGMPGGPQTPAPDSGLLGAILEGENGMVFVKMTGPKGLVKSSLADFKKMVESGLKK